MTTVGIILAAGKGERLNSTDTNKTALLFNGKPMIQYAVELFQKTVDQTVVVTGFAVETVVHAIPENLRKNVLFVKQREQMGTGHAVRVALEELKRQRKEFDMVLVGYGDHMMFYTPEVVRELVGLHKKESAAISMISTIVDRPDELAWGRVMRDRDENVLRVVEQKDATPEERETAEGNAGFYCFDASFLGRFISELTASPVSGEYYLTEMIEIAKKNGNNVVALPVPFDKVGVGVNTPHELQDSQSLHGRLAGGTIAE